MARQTYVLTRLHRRYDRAGHPRDVTLVPATPAVSHGVGVPKGPSHSFVRPSAPSKDEVQVRFVAFEPWQREMSCAETFRYRWGKRWESEARAARAVPVAIDLLSKSREPKTLLDALEAPLDELGLLPSQRPLAVAPAPTPSSERKSSRGSCGVATPPARGGLLLAFLVAAAIAVARHRR